MNQYIDLQRIRFSMWRWIIVSSCAFHHRHSGCFGNYSLDNSAPVSIFRKVNPLQLGQLEQASTHACIACCLGSATGSNRQVVGRTNESTAAQDHDSRSVSDASGTLTSSFFTTSWILWAGGKITKLPKLAVTYQAHHLSEGDGCNDSLTPHPSSWTLIFKRSAQTGIVQLLPWAVHIPGAMPQTPLEKISATVDAWLVENVTNAHPEKSWVET